LGDNIKGNQINPFLFEINIKEILDMFLYLKQTQSISIYKMCEKIEETYLKSMNV
jgi:hypothetical protein